MEKVPEQLQKLIEQSEANHRLLLAIKKALDQILDEWEDDSDDEDDEDDIREAFDECNEIKELSNFMSEWVGKSEIREVLRYLNRIHSYQFTLTGSEEKLLKQLEPSSNLDFDHLADAIENSVDLDE